MGGVRPPRGAGLARGDAVAMTVKKMEKEKFNMITLVNDDGCFDLQFRKDTRHERTGSPTYYRWKIQFVITTPKEQIKTLQKVQKEFSCGKVSITKDQARFSVQDIENITEIIIPYFTKNKLGGNKKSEFELWKKAATIIYNNKGIYLSKWKKQDLIQLMEIHKAMAKYKQKPRKQKHLEMAKILAQR